MMDILKSILFTLLGIAFGVLCALPMNTFLKIVFCVMLGFIWIVVLLLFIIFGRDNKKSAQRTMTATNANSNGTSAQNARISRNAQTMSQNVNVNAANAQPQSNPLDRKPMSVEKKEQYEKNRQTAKKVVLLNEEGTALMEWGLQRQTSLIIGKGSDKEPVDIDLSGSAVAQMISKQHAVLNYTEKGWYVDDIDSKNGTRVKKASQNAIMDVKLVGAIEVEPGDIIYIASTMLQIQ